MNLTIQRTYQPKCTPGDLLHNDSLLMHSLELPWLNNERNKSCIPEGTYLVIKEHGNQNRKYNYFRLPQVPGRSGILIHIGNYTKDVKGCIIVGLELLDLNKDGIIDIGGSTKALAKLWSYTPDLFTLTIKSK